MKQQIYFCAYTLIGTMLFITTISRSQSPGEISSNLKLWLKANSGVSGISPVISWSDQSGNNNHATSVLGSEPSKNNNSVNGNPTIQFTRISNTSGDKMSISGTFNLSNHHAFIITKENANPYPYSNVEYPASLGSAYNYASNSYPYMLITFQNYYWLSLSEYVTPQVMAIPYHQASSNNENIHIHEIKHISGTASGAVDGNNYSTGSMSFSSSISHYLGAMYASGTTYYNHYNGEIAEVIIYDAEINSSDRNQILTYLNIKYGISIAEAKHNYYSGFDYNHQITGIGRWDASNLDQRSSKNLSSTSILKIEKSSLTTSFPSDETFLIWGNNGEEMSSQFADSQTPSGISRKLQRIWKIQESGNNETVNLEFDLSDVPGGYSENNLELLIDDDGDFSNALRYTTGRSLTGSMLRFSGVGFDNTTKAYFTIGSTNYFDSPLPIELNYFEAERTLNSVQLKWQTLSETNNDYFRIDRSIDGINWKKITRIAGVGTTSNTTNYRYTDDVSITSLLYYRLVQVDFDGSFKIHPITSVNYAKQLILYPNPAANQISISACVQNISINNASGKSFPIQPIYFQSKTVIEIKHLIRGNYIITFQYKNQTFNRKFVIIRK